MEGEASLSHTFARRKSSLPRNDILAGRDGSSGSHVSSTALTTSSIHCGAEIRASARCLLILRGEMAHLAVRWRQGDDALKLGILEFEAHVLDLRGEYLTSTSGTATKKNIVQHTLTRQS